MSGDQIFTCCEWQVQWWTYRKQCLHVPNDDLSKAPNSGVYMCINVCVRNNNGGENSKKVEIYPL